MDFSIFYHESSKKMEVQGYSLFFISVSISMNYHNYPGRMNSNLYAVKKDCEICNFMYLSQLQNINEDRLDTLKRKTGRVFLNITLTFILISVSIIFFVSLLLRCCSFRFFSSSIYKPLFSSRFHFRFNSACHYSCLCDRQWE